MVKIENASYHYNKGKRQGIHNINLHIKKGECVLLCGESGCGKTTLTRLINGLVPYFYEGEFSGDVLIGRDNTRNLTMDEIACRVGSVFQNPRNQFFNVDTTSEIAFACENIGLPREEIQQRINKTVNDLDIARLMNKDIFALSGGEKQLIAIASAYALSPDIFVFDEPSANLDKKGRSKLAKLLQKLKAANKTIVIAEHRLEYIINLVDRAIYMKNGEITKTWSRDEFVNLSDSERTHLGLRALSYDGLRPNMDLLQNVVKKKHMIEIQDLSAEHHRNKPILKNLSFKAKSGEIVGLVGDNGEGKTTLARVMSGLHKRTNGSIILDQKIIPFAKRTNVAYLVMQEPGYQLFTDSVMKELSLSLVKKEKLKQNTVNEIAASLGLAEYQDRHPMSLSGGQKQRVAIATALTRQAKVLIFDEPTSGLDYKNMQRFVRLVTNLRQQGKIIFIITHDEELIYAACTRILYLKGGEISSDDQLVDL